MRSWLITLVFVFGSNIVLAGERFEAATEYPTSGWKKVSKAVAKIVLRNSGQKELLDDELAEKGLNKNYQNYFVYRAVALSSRLAKYMFVRPAFSPYISTFYGAHVFNYWILDEHGKVVFSSASDKFSVMEDTHNGMHDLLISQCYGGRCYDTRLFFHDGRYNEGECTAVEIAAPQVTMPCSAIQGNQ